MHHTSFKATINTKKIKWWLLAQYNDKKLNKQTLFFFIINNLSKNHINHSARRQDIIAKIFNEYNV